MKKLFSAAIAVFLFAGSAMPQGQNVSAADETEVKNFHLNMDKLNKFAAASKGLISHKKDRDELQAATQNDPDTRTISGMVRAIDKHPAAAGAIHQAGLTTREYAVMTMTMVTTVMVVAMKKQGAMKDVPSSVSAENVAFVDQNFDKVQELMMSMQGEQE